MTTANADWWKYTTTAFGTFTVSVLMAWASGASEWVTRSQAEAITQQTSPYNVDKEPIRLNFEYHREEMKRISHVMEGMQSDIKQLLAEVRRLEKQN